MRGIKTILMIPVAAVLLLAGACTGNSYDNSGGPHVVLEIISFTNPPVTAAVSATGFCSTTTSLGCTVNTDCPSLETCIIGGCTLTVVDWSVAFANVPKNSLSAGPANDIMMNAVDIIYTFPAGSPLPRTFGLGGQVIPTGGTGSINFLPIGLPINAALENSTGRLDMQFRGVTLEGTAINLQVFRDLTVEVCM
jgi:hypothetical protein